MNPETAVTWLDLAERLQSSPAALLVVITGALIYMVRLWHQERARSDTQRSKITAAMQDFSASLASLQQYLRDRDGN